MTRWIKHLLLLSGASLFAATWDEPGGGAWNVNGNWTSPSIFPNAIDAPAQFLGTNTQSAPVTLEQDIIIGALTFTSAFDYSISGGNNLTFNVSAGSATISASSTGTYTIACPVVLSDPLTITQSATSPLTISGAISGASAITSNGTGSLVLSANNSGFTGTFTQSAGTLLLTGSGSISAGTSLTINGATLDVTGTTSTTIPTLIGNSSGIVSVGSSALTINQQANQTFAGVIGGSGSLIMSVLSIGDLTLTNASNSFSGAVTLNAGRLALSGSGAIASISSMTIANATFDISQLTAGVSSTISNLSGSDAAARIDLGARALIISQGTSATFAGVIEDGGLGGGTGGALTKQGSGTLTLSGANTYTGGTTVSAGGLTVSGSLSSTGLVTVAEGATFTAAATQTIGGLTSPGSDDQTLGGSAVINAGVILTVNSASFPFFNGTISGSGGLTVNATLGNARALFNQPMTYTGATLVSAGTMGLYGTANIASSSSLTVNGATFDITQHDLSPTVTVNNLSGNGTGVIAIGSKSLTIVQTSPLTFAGVIQNNGILSASGGTVNLSSSSSSTLTLTNTNTFTGAYNIAGGTLALSGSGSIEAGSNAVVNGTLSISGVTTNATVHDITGAGTIALGTKELRATINNACTYSGSITGTGTMTKRGPDRWTLTGNNAAYTGTLAIDAGTVRLNGTVGGPVTVAAGARFEGNATCGNLTVTGTVAPGASIGTMNVADLSLGAASTTEIEINGNGTNDLIAASGTAAINGTLSVIAEPGVYVPGETWTIITSVGARSGTFSTVTVSNPRVSITTTYNANSVVLTNASSVITFNNVHATTYNAQSVINNLDVLSTKGELQGDASLYNVVATLANEGLAGIQFAVEQMHPAPYSAFTEQIAHLGSYLASMFHLKKESCMPGGLNIWLEPMGYIFRQKLSQDQVGFKSSTAGVAGGVDVPVTRRWIFGSAAAYTKSNLEWDNQRGQATVKAWHVGMYSDWERRSGQIGCALLVGRGRINSRRHMQFTTVNSNAMGNYYGIDTLANIHGKLNWMMGDDEVLSPFMDVTGSFLMQHSFTETGAAGLNLDVYNQKGSTVISQLGLAYKVMHWLPYGCWSPEVWLAWEQEIPIYRPQINSNFINMSVPFSVKGWNKVQQLINPGFRLNLAFSRGIYLNTSYSMEWGDHFFGQRADLVLEWTY